MVNWYCRLKAENKQRLLIRCWYKTVLKYMLFTPGKTILNNYFLTLHLTTNEFYNIYQSRIDQNEAKRLILVKFDRISRDPAYFLSDLCIGTKKCLQVPGQTMGIAFYPGLAS